MKKIFVFLVLGVIVVCNACKTTSLKEETDFEVMLPSNAITDTKAFIVWNSVSKDAEQTDYQIFLNGELLSLTAKKQNTQADKIRAAGKYTEYFYKYYTEELTGQKMLQVDTLHYTLEDLQENTFYKVQVKAITNDGKVINESNILSFKTKKTPAAVLNIKDFGARYGEKISYDDNNKNEKIDFIKANTKAIQTAIDECPKNGIVLIPAGIFVCGSLNLKSDMTLQIDGELCGSPFAENYDFGFLMYKYYTDTRYFGLINANGAKNITICGKGLVDGNGWKFEDENGNPTDDYQTYREESDLDYRKEKTIGLIKYIKGNNSKVYGFGNLADSCCRTYFTEKGLTPQNADIEELRIAYSRRSTTVILRNVENLFITGVTFTNPANHLINILDSKNISITGIIEHSYDCNNGDGIGLICTQNAYIWNNFFDCGDDDIVFSSGVGKLASTTGETGAGETKIFCNYFHHGHGGVAFGSHTALGIKNVEIHDNIFCHTDAPFRIKSAPANGGEVAYINFYNNALADILQSFIMSTEYSDAGTVSKYGAADKIAVFHDINLKNCSVFRAWENSIAVLGRKENPHYNINFSDITFTGSNGAREIIRNASVNKSNVTGLLSSK